MFIIHIGQIAVNNITSSVECDIPVYFEVIMYGISGRKGMEFCPLWNSIERRPPVVLDTMTSKNVIVLNFMYKIGHSRSNRVIIKVLKEVREVQKINGTTWHPYIISKISIKVVSRTTYTSVQTTTELFISSARGSIAIPCIFFYFLRMYLRSLCFVTNREQVHVYTRVLVVN